MRTVMRLLACAATCVMLTADAKADVPTNMNIQGILNDGAGDPLPAGLKNFTFKIFDQQVGGIEIWPAGPGETQVLATNAEGLWKAAVGTLTPLTPGVFADSSRWLEVTVDDGVNPIETLPRIKLNTVPYAFEAATLGGSSLGNLNDQFVNVPGDTMTGRLVLQVPWKALPGGSFRTNNVSDANGPTLLGGNTIAVLADAKSDGLEGKYALVGYTAGDTGSTVAVYGEGSGSGAFNVGVYGSVVSNAASNYSGYFYGGDFLVAGPDHPGDSAVQLPDNSISQAEIIDEPGIAVNTSSFGIIGLSTVAMADLITVTITIPTAGYIAVDGNFYGWVSGSAVSDATGYAQIDETAGGAQTVPYVRAWGELAPNTAGNRFYPVSVSRTYFKTAGSYTFRVEAMAATVSGTGAAHATYPYIRAAFYPHAYGSVTTVLAASDATEFSEIRSAPAHSVAGASDGLSTSNEALVTVDLRELELRALKARLEAERAERELAEAQGLYRPVRSPEDR